jgi:outer membrane immunogenic protein
VIHSTTLRRTIAFAWILSLPTFYEGSARADSSTDAVLKTLAALEARVAALESKNKEYKREAEEARSQARVANAKLLKLSNAPVSHVASAMASAYHPAEPTSSGWTGAYWGASAGGAATRSSVHSSQRDLQAFPSNPPPFNVTGYDVLGRASASNGGGVIDVFAGWNTRLSNFVVGGQLEATAAALNFSSSGSKAYAYFDANGPTGSTANGDFRPQVASRWMASALLRAGVLLNEQTLVYGIGGWTGAQFEARNLTDNAFYQPVETFWANGWTAGAGIERQLDTNWSVRAEYRYTGFAAVRTTDHFNFQSVGPASGTQSSRRQTHFDQSMQSGRIGFAYAFNPLR